MAKQSVRFLSFGALFLATALLFSSLFQRLDVPVVPVSKAVQALRPTPVIILDAGHGGEDGGASGTNGVLEKDLNLTISKDLAALLRLAGFSVVETRTEDRQLYDDGTPKGHKKQGDLQNRLKLTQQYENCVLISLHMNTFPNDSCEGVQVWYSPNEKSSVEWASAVQQAVRENLQPQNNRKIKTATSGIYILRHAKVPAILIECGFLSTPAECERLCDAQYRLKLTLTLFSAISEKVTAQS